MSGQEAQRRPGEGGDADPAARKIDTRIPPAIAAALRAEYDPHPEDGHGWEFEDMPWWVDRAPVGQWVVALNDGTELVVHVTRRRSMPTLLKIHRRGDST